MRDQSSGTSVKVAGPTALRCRFCSNKLTYSMVDLGMSPLCESYVPAGELNSMEAFYPLRVYVCDRCYLAQLDEYVAADEIFSEYAYFSSYADSWVQHAKEYADLMIHRFGLSNEDHVVEVASNDGYLLQHFVALGIPVLGVEPAENVAAVAEEKGIPTLVEFFGVRTAQDLVEAGRQADLLLGNNVLAQVPDLNDFVAGMKLLLKRDGLLTMEFPHLLKLIKENQFDTIYHEHYSYFSFLTVEKIFAAHGLTLFDVEEIPTHGGSLRIYGRHTEDTAKPIEKGVVKVRELELDAGLNKMETYDSFSEQVKETKRKVLHFLIGAKREGKSVAGYGAPGKGNTLLNYCGIRTDFIDYTVDRNPYKQGKFLPGTHIPIYSPGRLKETQPDFVFILPWNFKDEIMDQTSYIREWGGRFVVPVPQLEVYD